MSQPSPQNANPAPEGVGHLVRSVLATILAHLEARLDLATIETREVSSSIIQKGLLIAGASTLSSLGYALLLIALISLAADRFQVQWEYITLGVSVAHFFLAFILVAVVRAKLSGPFFQETLKQFQKDRQWLQSNKNR